jgi:alpha-N-acetylglucosamine transferase
MAVFRTRILVFAAAIATGILYIFGAYSQGVTMTDVSNLAYKITSHMPSVKPSQKLAYMTLLTNTMHAPENPSDDRYFMATRILGYQLMHQPSTKTQKNIPFVVLVTADVIQSKRDLLVADGAIVIEVKTVDVDTSWVIGEMPEWKDVMDKLRAWEFVQYEKVAFLDGDFILNRCMDGIFDDPATERTPLTKSNTLPEDEGELPETYVLATVAEVNPFHKYPPTAENNDYKDPNYFNAGFFIFAPDLKLYSHFQEILTHKGRFDPKYPEQNLLNYAFRREGQMPWVEMEGSWHIRFPSVHDKESGVASMHDKWWSAHMDKKLQPYYDSIRWKMEGYYEARNESTSTS